MGLLNDYFNNDAKYHEKYGEKCIFLMHCGHFFEVYGLKDSDGNFTNNKIENFSKVCDMTIAPKCSPGRTGKKHQMYKGKRVYMAGFSPVEKLDKYVSRLTQNGYIVPVWVQDPKVPSIRSELGIFTPGTSFDNNQSKISNMTMCLWIEKKSQTLMNKNPVVLCGMAVIDVYTGSSFMFEFKETYFHSPSTYDEIERFYSTYHPTELVVVHNYDDDIIDEILQFAGIECSTIHKISTVHKDSPYCQQIKNCEKQPFQKELLERFYDIKDYENFYESLQFRQFSSATLAFCFLLDFLSTMQPQLVKKIKEPVFNNNTDRLILANHSAKQLNISNAGNHLGKCCSVVSFLNRCKTSMGKRKITQMLLNPTTNIEFLKREFETIQYIKDGFGDWEKDFMRCSQICDFERLYRKIVLKRATPAEIMIFYNNLTFIKYLSEKVANDEFLTSYIYLPNLSSSIKKFVRYIKKHLKRSVAATICTTSSFDENFFRRGVYSELDAVMLQFMETDDKLQCIKGFFETLLSKYEKKKRNTQYVKRHVTEKSGLYFEITKRRSAILQKAIEEKHSGCNIVELSYTSSFDSREKKVSFDVELLKYSSGTSANKRLDSPTLTALYIEQFKGREMMRKKLKDVYATFLESVREFKSEMNDLIQFVIKLDVLLTRAKLALDYHYCCPIIDEKREKSFFSAKDMRHILIEQIQKQELYVPNDISLGDTSQDGILLYGTNAVGKSSLIKSIGICIVMAQSGFFVPCSEFIFKPYKSLFTRILGNDNIFKGLSTFAVEMSELNVILRNSNNDSLVLGDEVCSGTETISALSIFISALKQLNDNKCSFIFATHLHEITDFPYLKDMRRISLKHMSIRCNEKGVIIYDRKLKNGSGSNIYGLEVCKSLNMPKDFLERAYKIRLHISPEDKSVLSMKTSRYNSNKLKNKCELCGDGAEDVHHMYPQKKADKQGHIKTFHKNHPANLMNICKKCHANETNKDTIRKRVKTTSGMRTIVMNENE